MFDIIAESDSSYIMYKLARLIEALNLGITGNFELKDQAKIVVGKEMCVDISIDEKQDPPKSQVDIFSGKIFYPIGGEVAATEIPQPAVDMDTPFAVDPAPTTPATEY